MLPASADLVPDTRISVDITKKSPLKRIGTFIMLIERQEIYFETESLSSQPLAFDSTCLVVPPVAVQEAIFRRPRFHQKLGYVVVSVRNLLSCHCVISPPAKQRVVGITGLTLCLAQRVLADPEAAQ